MEPPSSPSGGTSPLAVLVPERRWRRLVPGAESVVRRAARVAGGVDGAVVLEGDLAVRRLNARHRGRNTATNVLTFEPGDIVLAYGVVRREARAARRPASHHLAHLVVHAVLHLDGYGHATAGQARRMEQEEARLLARIGVPNPWKPRALPERAT